MYFDNCTTIDELKAVRNELLRQYHPDANGNVDNDEIREINAEYTKRSAEFALQEEAEQNTDAVALFLKGAVVVGVEALYKKQPKVVKKINDLLSKSRKQIRTRRWLNNVRKVLNLMKIQMWANIIIGLLTLAMWIIFFTLIFKHLL